MIVDRYIATSQYCRRRMVEFAGLPEERIDVVLPGLNLDRYLREAINETRDGPASTPNSRPLTLGFLSRIAPEKGLDMLVEAFARLARSEAPDLRLRIGGYLGRGYAGYAAGIRRRLAAAGLSRRVDFLGTLTPQEKVNFLRSVDILCVPTRHPEPKGMFVLEAFASGVPVVQPRHGAFEELLELSGGGLLCAPNDLDDLVQQLRALIADPEQRRECGARARRAASELFSAARMGEETSAVYERVRRAPALGVTEAG